MIQSVTEQVTAGRELVLTPETGRPDLQSKRSANVGAAERGLTAALGLAFGAAGLLGLVQRRRGLGSLLMGLAGGALMFHGAKRHSLIYDLLGVTDEDAGATTHPLRRQIHVRRSITIHKPVDQVYGFWRNPASHPKFMEMIEDVQPIDEKRWHWVAAFPMVGRVEWDSEMTDDRPNERISWAASDAGVFDQRGMVTFRHYGQASTEVTAEMVFRMRGGAVGIALAKVIGKDPENVAARNLQRAKQLLEAGEVASNAGPSCRG
jgi:uncharacterized membrane protein